MDIGGFWFFRLFLLLCISWSAQTAGSYRSPTITLLTTSLDIVYTYEAHIPNLKSLSYDSLSSKNYSIVESPGEQVFEGVESAESKASTK